MVVVTDQGMVVRPIKLTQGVDDARVELIRATKMAVNLSRPHLDHLGSLTSYCK